MLQKVTKAFGKYQVFLVCIFLVGSVLVVYGQVRNHKFIHLDDSDYITGNEQIQAGLSRENITWAFTTGCASNWHPLTWLSLMLDYQLYGNSPRGFHMTNLLLHLANVLLVFGVLKWMTGSVWRSAFVAALFALHPLHVESVAWAAERKDVLSTLFWMLTMAAYLRYVKRPSVSWYLLTMLAFTLGLMAKPMLVTLPFVLLLLDYWPIGRLQWRTCYRLVLEKVPFLALSAVSSVVTFLVQQSGGAVVKVDRIPLDIRVPNAFVSYLAYILKMIWPSNLAVYYPHRYDRLPTWQVVVAAVLLLGISIWIVRSARSHKYLLVGWLWYLGTLVPVIGLVQVGHQAMADRYTYVPLIGLFIIVAWGAGELVAKWPNLKIAVVTSAGVAVSAIMICTWVYAGYWRDSFTLFNHVLEATGENSIAHYCLSNAFYEQKQYDKALYHAQQVLRVVTDNPKVHHHLAQAYFMLDQLDEAILQWKEILRIKSDYPDAYSGLANIYVKKGQIDEAIGCFNEALRLKPDDAKVHNDLALILVKKGLINEAIEHYNKALRIGGNSADVHNNLGSALMDKGEVKEAILHYRKAIALAQDRRLTQSLRYTLSRAHYNLANILRTQGQFEEAVEHFKETLKTDPNDTDAYYGLGMALAELKKYNEALDCYKASLKLKPDFAQVHYNLGMALFNLGRLDEAISEFREVLRIHPEDAEMHCNLGVLLARKGLVDQAVEEFRTALRLDPNLTRASEELKTVLAKKKSH